MDNVPEWVARHVEKHLAARGRLINVRSLQARGGTARYLANTTDGAAIVERRRGGEPVVHVLALPGEDVVFTCSVCDHRMRVSGQALPVDVHCAMCTSLHRLRSDAQPVLLARGTRPEAVRVPGTPRLVRIDADGSRRTPAGTPGNGQGTTQDGGFASRRQATAPAPPVPYRHGDYTLHGRDVKLASGTQRTIYFFAKRTPKSGAPCALPEGYEVKVVGRTGLPVLRRSGRHGSQCGALTAAGSQCRNTARPGATFCGQHRGYRATAGHAIAAVDTKPRAKVLDTEPAVRGRVRRTPAVPAQCMAMTEAGSQCRSTGRAGSKYCARHKGYRPPTASGLLKARDTKPRNRSVKDTRVRVL